MAPFSGSLYRARVVALATDTVEVFFVDYGNYAEVAIKDLYAWEPIFGQIPFQAIRFKIAGIEPNKAERQDVRAEALYKQLVHKTLIGIVM